MTQCISELTKKYLSGLSESNKNSILTHETLSYKSFCLCKDLLKFALLCGVLYHDFGCTVSLLGMYIRSDTMKPKLF